MTIKDLAKISGYSLGTVSRALNHQPNVSPKARDIILSLAQKYGYEINASAQSLKKRSGDALLVIVKGRANELFFQLVERTQTLAAAEGRPLVVDYIDEDENEVHRAVQLCREKKPAGILFFGGTTQNFLADFGKITLPAVLVTNSAQRLPYRGLSSVTTDDTAAAQMIISLLIQNGHKEIAVIGGDPEVSEISKNRLTGCNLAFQASGARLSVYEPAHFSFEGGYQAMEQILEKSGSTTAVFAMSDVMAIGAMRCIRDHGLQIPGDISVVGFDGLPFGQYYTPKLATVSQSVQALADTGYQVLCSAISGAEASHIHVPFSLSFGESIRTLAE